MNVTMQGEHLLATLRCEARSGLPVAAMLRHAARHPIADSSRPELAELTPEGRGHARDFGAQLREFASVRLFHSPVVRCRQTAELIAQGVEGAGGRAELHGAHSELGIDYIRNLAEAGRLHEAHGEHLVRLWFGGQVPPGILAPAPVLAAMKLRFVQEHLAQLDRPGTLDLHVSHDWNILILREHFVGVRHEEAGWLNFLDGVAFRPAGSSLRVVYRDHAREIAAAAAARRPG